MEAQAAVLETVGEPLVLETITVDKPWPHEILVKTVGSGVCHSELLHVDGIVQEADFSPMVMGHEGAGIVEAVGDEVTAFRPGDHIVACSKSFCGTCAECLSGHPNLCVTAGLRERPPGAPTRLSLNGKPLRQFGGVSSHSEYMLLHENCAVKVADEYPLDVSSILGCGVLTGMGAILWTARLNAGESVAVFGCGGVGLSAIQGARIGGARQIIAIDQLDQKLDLAKRCGATDTVNASQVDAVQEIRRLTNGAGVDHALEMVGNSKLVRQCVESLGVRGTATLVGILPTGSMIEFPVSSVMPECRVQTSRMGSTRFRIEIPRYLEFYKQGRLQLDDLVTGRGHLEDIDKAFNAMRSGEAARTVIVFD